MKMNLKPGWQSTKSGEREVLKALCKVIYVKYQIKDKKRNIPVEQKP